MPPFGSIVVVACLGLSWLRRATVVSGFAGGVVRLPACCPAGRLAPRARRRRRDDSSTSATTTPSRRSLERRRDSYESATRTHALSPAAASLLAGSLAGVIGIGVAFPLDTVNTRSQLQQSQAEPDDEREVDSCSSGNRSHQRTTAAPTTPPTTTGRPDPIDTARAIFRQEGWRGFFPGVRGTMAGESVVKAVAFSANTLALTRLQEASPPLEASTGGDALLVQAACFAGLVTAFVVAPVERIKVVLQTSPPGTYRNEWDCIGAILREQGWGGLLLGLDATLARDVPGYGLYFAIYGLLMQSGWDLGPLSPVVYGAAAGSASWIPVYPVDVVKTMLQRNVGDGAARAPDAWQVVAQLYSRGGPAAFYAGLTPKLLRAAVSAATSYSVYESLMSRLLSG